MVGTSRPADLVTADVPQSGLQERASDVITGFCGDMKFVYVHVALFAVWIGTRGFGQDHFPFNFLTMAVSLEAIFLSTFILISQNRQQAIADANNQLIQQRLLQMLDDVISDEKLDLKNEDLIRKLLTRIDVERISPIMAHIKDISECVARIEAGVQSSGTG
ncbi:MAG: DUF1003 domain-containing protein [Chloroflexota bacterium]|nr:DUF1003 domain-containing protein [Chloroflexota bacterium]